MGSSFYSRQERPDKGPAAPPVAPKHPLNGVFIVLRRRPTDVPTLLGSSRRRIQSRGLAGIGLGPAHPPLEGFDRAAQFLGDRSNRGPLRGMVVFVIETISDGAYMHFGEYLLVRDIGFILSEPFDKPGTVHGLVTRTVVASALRPLGPAVPIGSVATPTFIRKCSRDPENNRADDCVQDNVR